MYNYLIDGEGNFLRTQIMTTKEVYKLEAGEIIVVPFNDRNQPIKSAGGLFTRFMTLLVKEPNLCPLDAKDWKECKKRCGIRLLMELRVITLIIAFLFCRDFILLSVIILTADCSFMLIGVICLI